CKKYLRLVWLAAYGMLQIVMVYWDSPSACVCLDALFGIIIGLYSSEFICYRLSCIVDRYTKL
ncbi:hypothetical protein NDU88_002096, partial [Pleurodeles waltl]